MWESVMNRFSWWLALAALAWCGALPASAEERSGRVKGSVKDPVETAFELPQGARLTPAQAKALNKMRHDYEPQLRDALDKMNSETNVKTKRSDAKDALRIRQTIRGEIDQILNSGGAYEASPTAAPATYESRYPAGSGTGEAPYYVPYAYPAYPYPYYPGAVYPYYSRPYYYGPRTSTTGKPTTTSKTSQGNMTWTARPASQTPTSKTPNTTSGGVKYTTKR
jgi:hypothetical protein